LDGLKLSKYWSKICHPYLFTDQAYDKVTLGAKCAKGDSVEMANSFQKQLRKVGG
jgi:hypothetical protein